MKTVVRSLLVTLALSAPLAAASCAGGEVSPPCQGREQACDGECVEVLNNVDHCGGCGQRCAAGQICCEGGCIDQDDLNCGACGQRCGEGTYCQLGKCAPCDTDARCGPTCKACKGTTPHCREGQCVQCTLDAHCSPGSFCEKGLCVACTRDDHCGPLCKACAPGTSCNGTACIVCTNDLDCGPGKFCEGSLCHDCKTDQHCGPNCESCTGSAKPFCNAAGTACGECGNDGHCPLSKYCSNGTCLACVTAEHCGPLCARCTGTSTPYCSPSGCAECLKDLNCRSGHRCSSGACVPCTSDEHCGPTCAKCTGTSTPLCGGSDQGCVQCLLDPHCAQGNFCQAGVCKPCTVDQHCGVACVSCGGSTPFCSPASGKCVACLVDGNCSPGTYCQAGSCAPCNTDAHCGQGCVACAPGTFCNGFSCVGCCGPSCLLCKPQQYCAGDLCKACNTDDHCGPTCQACGSATPRCKDGSICVECLVTPDCPPGEYCASNTCQPCSTMSQCGPACTACAAGQTCCGPTGGCASLLTDKLNCGACGKACSTFCNKGLCDASIKCSVALNDDIFSTPAVDSAGNVYVVSSTGKVSSYKPDCTLRWSFSAGYYTTSSPVLSPDEKSVYVSTTGGPATLYALDTGTGGKVWSQVVGVGWSDFNTPAVASDGTIYAVGCTASGGTYHQTVQALSPAGVAKWSVNISSTGSSTNTGGPAIGADGTIYAMASNGQVAAITASGQPKWSVSLGCCSTNVSPALGSDGHLYVIASTGKTLYKLNTATGATIWSRSLGSLQVTHVSPVTDGQGNVFLALPDGTVRAWAADGTGLWSLPASGAYNSSLALGSDGVLYAVNGSNGSLRALSSASGATLWSLQVANAVSSSPNLSSDGILWVGAGKKLWAVTTGAVTGLASKGYPKRHADRANSGRD